MAFGIDDALSAAAAGINLTTTLVETVERFKKKKIDYDLEMLIHEIKLTALRRIDDADLALGQFERMMLESKIDIDKTLIEVISKTPFWNPFQQHRLSQIHKQFNQMADSIYCSCDDIAALLRCQGEHHAMGGAIVNSVERKHEFYSKLLSAPSLRGAIGLLRSQLAAHKATLSG